MADKPRFSVTIPAFNAQGTLAQTVESVRAQTLTDWELVIVDDGSTDATRAVADRFAQEEARVRVVSQSNRGSGGAYNAAVRSARGDLLVMLSADDLLLPDHLATFDACIRDNPEASVFTSDGWYEYEDGRRETARPQARWSDPAECTLEELLAACFYGVGAVYRREVFDAVDGFREGIYAEDYLFWLLALAHGFRHRHIDRPLSVHRRGTVQKSANALLMRETDLRVLSEVVGTGLLSDSQLAAARRSTARLQRNIAVRKILAKSVGPTGLQRLTARISCMRAGAPAKHAPVTGGLAVAFINNFPGPSLGGGEVQLLALLRGLLAAGVRPSVVCAAGSALERETRDLEGVHVIPVDFALCCLPSLITALSARLQAVHIVQGTGFLTNLIARRVGARAHACVVNTVHVLPGAARLDGGSRASGALRTALERPSRRSVARFVAVSQAVRIGLMADRVAASRIAVIPNGIDLARLRCDAEGELAVTLRQATARVGFVGRLERIKGVEYFLLAAAILAADHPDVRFVVAGKGSREGELRALAADLGISGRIEFLGHVDSVPSLLAVLDVVVVPSLSEASGLTAMEALGLGVPVVATRVGGLPEIVVDEETGLLVAPGDEVALARAVARLLDDHALARTLAEAGARRVEERFALARMVDGYLRLYRELVS
jgi:glycosyltransferase involved in cell wall biosynthesis/GT2 family glycosyltransferase